MCLCLPILAALKGGPKNKLAILRSNLKQDTSVDSRPGSAPAASPRKLGLRGAMARPWTHSNCTLKVFRDADP